MTKYDIKKTIVENGIEYGSQLIEEEIKEKINKKIAASIFFGCICALAVVGFLFLIRVI
jgi:hypothetical protein